MNVTTTSGNPQTGYIGKGFAEHITIDGVTSLCGKEGMHTLKDINPDIPASAQGSCVRCKARIGYRGNR